jgi:ATP-dependent protease ClpP protease subunit
MIKQFKIFTVLLFTMMVSSCANTEDITIAFNSNGGTVIEPMTLEEASLIELPDHPTKEGYIFLVGI